MFFDPLWLYLKQILVTLIVEMGLLYLLVRPKKIDIFIAVFINITTHISLHIFLSLMIVTAYPYALLYIVGEVLVWIIEAFLYYISKIISSLKKSFLFSLLFNVSSIVIGYVINLFFLDPVF